jgi:eukaryotic-like serine/threonine-protein kinase
MSPTITTPAMTQAGMILGTAAYMSPEQAKGRPADRRSDIWSFGVVLYEMLTGQRAFKGEDVSDTLAFILTREPDWTALRASTPPSIRRLLRRCLEKDPKRRLHAAADARLEIEEPLAATESLTPAAAPFRRIATIAMATLASGAVVAALVTWAVMRPAPQPPVLATRFAIVPPPALPLAVSGTFRDIALSPDGRQLVYRSGGFPTAGGPLMVRALDQLDARPLAGVTNAREPFFSSNGRWMGFFDGAELKKVSLTGGPAITVCPLGSQGTGGASWGDDNAIIFATSDERTGLRRVSADGGEPAVLTTPDAAQHEVDHRFPSVLPDGRGVLFTVTTAQAENSQVAVLDLKTGQRKTLVHGGSHAEYVEPGYLVYTTSGALRAVRFDFARLEVLGDSVPVIESLSVTSGGRAEYAVSRTGALVYVPVGASATLRSLVWVNRMGNEEPIKAPPRAYSNPRVSPDGTRIALYIATSNPDIWTWDLARETLTRVASGLFPTWTPDGRRLVFQEDRGGNLFWQAADGTGSAERLTTSTNTLVPTSITPDGTRIVGYQVAPKTRDLVVVRLTNPAGQLGAGPSPGTSLSRVESFIETRADEVNPEISPDARYVAYQSNESGRFEVYVQTFPQKDRRWQISREGGTRPAWARTGRELFYLDAANTLTAVQVRTSGSAFTVGNPVKVFDTKYAAPQQVRQYDVRPGDQRFLMMNESGGDPTATPASMVVVLNWSEELKAKVPTK